MARQRQERCKRGGAGMRDVCKERHMDFVVNQMHGKASNKKKAGGGENRGAEAKR